MERHSVVATECRPPGRRAPVKPSRPSGHRCFRPAEVYRRARSVGAPPGAQDIEQATRTGSLVAGAREAAQHNLVQQLHEPPLHLEQAIVVKAGEHPAHGFELESQVASDLLARHSQHKLA